MSDMVVGSGIRFSSFFRGGSGSPMFRNGQNGARRVGNHFVRHRAEFVCAGRRRKRGGASAEDDQVAAAVGVFANSLRGVSKVDDDFGLAPKGNFARRHFPQAIGRGGGQGVVKDAVGIFSAEHRQQSQLGLVFLREIESVVERRQRLVREVGGVQDAPQAGAPRNVVRR